MKLEQQRLDQLRLEQQRLEAERRKREEDGKNDQKKPQAPSEPEQPGIETRGFIVGGELSTNDYKSGTLSYWKDDRQNPLNIFSMPILVGAFRTKGYGAFGVHTGYQSKRWYFLADAFQLRGHTRYEEIGYGFSAQQAGGLTEKGMLGLGIATLQRDALSSRLAFTPVPPRWSLRPYVYAGYGSTAISTHFDHNNSNPNFGSSPSLSWVSGRVRSSIQGAGPEAGVDLRFVRENGFEIRVLYGQAWHRGELRTAGDIIAARLGPVSSPTDNLWLRVKLVGDANMHIQKYAVSVFSPRLGRGRLYAGLRAEHSRVEISKVAPDYLPITEISLLTGGTAAVLPDFIVKQAQQRVGDSFRGGVIGWESIL